MQVVSVYDDMQRQNVVAVRKAIERCEVCMRARWLGWSQMGFLPIVCCGGRARVCSTPTPSPLPFNIEKG